MSKPFNPLFPESTNEVTPVLATLTPGLDEEVVASDVLNVVCGPQGVDIPAQVHVVTPILK